MQIRILKRPRDFRERFVDKCRLRVVETISLLPSPRSQRFRLLGILPLLFFLAQAIHYWQIKQLGHLLWMCNVSNILLGFGLLTARARLIRIAVVWLVPGLFIWWRYVVGEWFGYANLDWWAVFSSTLAHVGGLSVGIVALRRVRIDLITWLYAFGWYVLMQLVSHLITAPELNVNVSQKIYGSWYPTFESYFKFWLVLTLLVGVCLSLITWLLSKLWPCGPKEQP